jgi:membrane protein implicated in regulation of membrane protease activity
MELFWEWWLAAVALVILEMFSGTFYLLAVASGFIAAGLAAYLGAAWSWQVVVAALVCSASVGGIYRWLKQQAKPETQANFDYDIGQNVQIVSWTDACHARVSYRGAEWDAELSSVAACDSAKTTWHIKEMAGSILIIE